MLLPFVKEEIGQDGKTRVYVSDENRLIDLYKYYEGVSGQARGQMVVTVNWLLSFAIGVFVFTAKNAIVVTQQWHVCRSDNILALAAPIAGSVLCWMVLTTISEFRGHVSRNWMRATRCKYLVDDLHRLVAATTEEIGISDKTRWPEHLMSYDAYDDYHPPKGEKRQRAKGIFGLYKLFAIALILLFLALFFLSLLAEVCPTPQPLTPAPLPPG